jgi:hypothetical protein
MNRKQKQKYYAIVCLIGIICLFESEYSVLGKG